MGAANVEMGNRKYLARRRRRWVALIAMLGFASAARAQGFDIVVGPSVTSGQRTTAAAFASAFGTSEPGRFHLEPIATIGWIRAHHTTRADLDHTVWTAGGGLRLVSPGNHWFASLQLARTSARTDALSSHWEFIDSAGWQNGHFVLMVRHMSNGHIVGGSPNLGETMLLAGLRW